MVPVVNVVIMIITITANARGEGRGGRPARDAHGGMTLHRCPCVPLDWRLVRAGTAGLVV